MHFIWKREQKWHKQRSQTKGKSEIEWNINIKWKHSDDVIRLRLSLWTMIRTRWLGKNTRIIPFINTWNVWRRREYRMRQKNMLATSPTTQELHPSRATQSKLIKMVSFFLLRSSGRFASSVEKQKSVMWLKSNFMSRSRVFCTWYICRSFLPFDMTRRHRWRSHWTQF